MGDAGIPAAGIAPPVSAGIPAVGLAPPLDGLALNGKLRPIPWPVEGVVSCVARGDQYIVLEPRALRF